MCRQRIFCRTTVCLVTCPLLVPGPEVECAVEVRRCGRERRSQAHFGVSNRKSALRGVFRRTGSDSDLEPAGGGSRRTWNVSAGLCKRRTYFSSRLTRIVLPQTQTLIFGVCPPIQRKTGTPTSVALSCAERPWSVVPCVKGPTVDAEAGVTVAGSGGIDSSSDSGRPSAPPVSSGSLRHSPAHSRAPSGGVREVVLSTLASGTRSAE